jgi:hypothetical protein
MIEFFEADDLTPFEDLVFAALNAGELSDVLTCHVWNEKGNPGGQAVENVLLLIQTEDPGTPDLFVSSGVPPQDELWGRLRIVGQVNAADPSWVLQPTGWRVAGAYAGLLVGRIPPDCAAIVEIAMRPPGTALELGWSWQLTALRDEYSRPLPPLLARLSSGVLPIVGTPTAHALLSGHAVTPSGPADDEVHVAPGLAVLAGPIHGFITEAVQLDQDDSAVEALEAGESYLAVLTRAAGGVTVTKGARAAAPVEPAAPADEPLLAVVTVHFQGGGTSSIEAADIDTGRAGFTRFHAEPGTGAALRISAGQAAAGETWRFRDGWIEIPLEDDDDNWLWLLTSGLLDVTQTAAPPEEEALLLWEATVAAAVITALVDRRTYAGRQVAISLRGAFPGTVPGLVDELTVGHELLHLEAVTLRASDNGGGSAGETVADLEVNGVTVFTAQATEDLRPRVAFDAAAAALQSTSAAHQVTELRRGDVLAFSIDVEPTGGSPARVELILLCRLP